MQAKLHNYAYKRTIVWTQVRKQCLRQGRSSQEQYHARWRANEIRWPTTLLQKKSWEIVVCCTSSNLFSSRREILSLAHRYRVQASPWTSTWSSVTLFSQGIRHVCRMCLTWMGGCGLRSSYTLICGPNRVLGLFYLNLRSIAHTGAYSSPEVSWGKQCHTYAGTETPLIALCLNTTERLFLNTGTVW